jgi:hypothetical protein
MRKLLLLGLLTFAAVSLHAQTQTTVVGTVTNPAGVLATSGYVQFSIKPSSQSILFYIPGLNIQAPTVGRCSINGSGLIKSAANLANPCLVWGNDVISPGNTTYDVLFAPNGTPGQLIHQLLISGVTYSLFNPVFAPQVTITPQYQTLITPPLGSNLLPISDNVFNIGQAGRRYAGGYFTNLTVTNSMAFSNLTVTGPLHVTGLSTLDGGITSGSTNAFNNTTTATGAISTSIMYTTQVVGDTNNRFRIRADGLLTWDNGTDNTFPTNIFNIGNGSVGGLRSLNTYYDFRRTDGVGANIGIEFNHNLTNTVGNLEIWAEGSLNFSGGSSTADVKVQRTAVGVWSMTNPAGGVASLKATGDVTLSNNRNFAMLDTGATARNLIGLDNGNAINVGRSATGQPLQLFSGGAGVDIVAFNSAVTELGRFRSGGGVSAAGHLIDLGTACTNGELVLSAGWGNTPNGTVTAVAGTGQTCQWTITAGGAATGANPTITDTLTNTLPAATIVCDIRQVGGTGAASLINQTTLSATVPIFTFGGTPTASATYFVVRRCGP